MEFTKNDGKTAKVKEMAESCSSFSNYEVAEILGASFDLSVISSRQSVLEKCMLLAPWVWNKFEPVISVRCSFCFA